MTLELDFKNLFTLLFQNLWIFIAGLYFFEVWVLAPKRRAREQKEFIATFMAQLQKHDDEFHLSDGKYVEGREARC